MNKVVITGANRGIGLAMVQQFVARGDSVVALCRQSSPALEATGAHILTGFDASNELSIRSSLAALKDLSIDILINNAGILRDEQLGAIHVQQIESQFFINAVAPLLVVDALKSQLTVNAKVALITSRMGSIEDNTSGGRYGYRMSKAALNAAGMSLSHDLKSQRASVAILHPGYVQTDMVGGRGDISASTAAERLIQRIDELTLDTSGTFWHSNGQILPW